MKVSVAEDRTIVIGEVYCNTVLETSEGNRVAICMRDDTIEFNVLPKAGGERWFRIDMQELTVTADDEIEVIRGSVDCENGCPA